MIELDDEQGIRHWLVWGYYYVLLLFVLLSWALLLFVLLLFALLLLLIFDNSISDLLIISDYLVNSN